MPHTHVLYTAVEVRSSTAGARGVPLHETAERARERVSMSERERPREVLAALLFRHIRAKVGGRRRMDKRVANDAMV